MSETKTFKIEKVKWKWAKEVKSPSVYRDDEFIVCGNKKETLDSVHFLLKQPKGLTYTITVKRDGKYYTYFRHSMPCLGGLVKYRDSHGEKYFLNPYFPRDISVAFPDGDIVFIGCHRPNILQDIKKPYYQFILSQESPWVSAFNNSDSIIFADNHFILTDMNTDPTVFYSLMRLGGFANGYGASSKPNWNPKADILYSKCINANADARRLAAANPIRISGGTWAENYGFTRPYNESIFKTKIPHKLKDFASLARYPQAPQTNEYFVSTMKEKFKVDVNKADKEVEDALIKAWDYFKKESKKLDDGFPA